MPKLSAAERRLAMDDALANTAIEGHVPTADFLHDCDAVVAGTMSIEDAIRAARSRALKMDAEASGEAAASSLATNTGRKTA